MDKSKVQKDSQHQEKDKGKIERTKGEAKQMLLKEVELGKKYLIEGQTAKANDLAFKALIEFKEDLGGENSVLLLPGYFILAEANIAEGKLKKAEEFLIAAYWNFLKFSKPEEKKEGEEDSKVNQDDISEEYEFNAIFSEIVSYRGTLHKTFSKLFLAQKDYTKALDELKNGIYMDSVKYGPEHVITSLSYYQMGMIFLQKRQQAEAEQFFGKTVQIWYKYLKNFFKNADNPEREQLPDEVVLREALQILKQIEKYFNRYQEDSRRLYLVPITRIYYGLALIYKIFREEDQFRNYIGMVYQEFLTWRGETDHKTRKIRELVELINQTQG